MILEKWFPTVFYYGLYPNININVLEKFSYNVRNDNLGRQWTNQNSYQSNDLNLKLPELQSLIETANKNFLVLHKELGFKDELIPIIIDLVLKKKHGTINMVNPGVISHNEILNMYKEIVDPNFTWDNFSIEEQDKILKSKRSNNHLDTTLIEKLYPNIKNIKDSIRLCLLNYK